MKHAKQEEQHEPFICGVGGADTCVCVMRGFRVGCGSDGEEDEDAEVKR